MTSAAKRSTSSNAWASLRRAVVSGLLVGTVFGFLLLISREVLGGRPLPFWIENTAGIWFVAAFVAGALARGPVAGAAAGVGALVLGLVVHDAVSFSTGDGFTIHLHPILRTLWIVISAAVGAAMGAIGGWAVGVRQRWWIATGAVGGLVVGEAVALFVGGPPHPAFDPRIGAAQAVLGVVGVLSAVRGTDRWRALGTAVVVALAIVLVEGVTGLVSRLVWG